MIDKFSFIHIKHGSIYWKSKPKYFSIVSQFDSDEWHKIYYDIDTDEEFNVLLQYPICHCFVVYNKPQLPIGFVILLNNRKDKHKVSIHGGMWKSGYIGKSYHAIIILIDWLLRKGYKIRSSCLLSNDNAFRFLHSVGFIKYYSNDKFCYLWLKEQRFRTSAIYKKIMI